MCTVTRYSIAGCHSGVTVTCHPNVTEPLVNAFTESYIYVRDLVFRNCPAGALWFVIQCAYFKNVAVMDSGGPQVPFDLAWDGFCGCLKVVSVSVTASFIALALMRTSGIE